MREVNYLSKNGLKPSKFILKKIHLDGFFSPKWITIPTRYRVCKCN